jgi:predicted RND superfamily exporter protein
LTIQEPGFGPAGIPIEVRLVGEDLDARHPAPAGQTSRDRLHAILMSSSTTIAGLLPLLAETSTQAAAIKPLVMSVVFGLLTATVLVVLVIPALYVLLDAWGLARCPQPTR